MADNSPNGDTAEEQAVNALAEIGRNGGVVGMYFVDVRLCPKWRRLLQDAGVPATHSRVEAEIVGRPVLPNFN